MFDQIKQILTEKFQVEADAITPGAVLEELGFDSLDAVELSLELESQFGLHISEDEIAEARIVDDLTRLAESHTEAA